MHMRFSVSHCHQPDNKIFYFTVSRSIMFCNDISGNTCRIAPTDQFGLEIE